MLKDITLGQYFPGNSPLHRMDPRTKILGICLYIAALFLAKTIVSYSKMAYDNVLLGHFHAVKMISRSILENCVFLDIIISNDYYELWKYYLVYSYRSTIYKAGRCPSQSDLDMLKKTYQDYKIDEDFYVKQPERKKAYIREPYGWT